MNDTAVNATMQGGTAGLVGVGVAHIENLYVGATPFTPAPTTGPIPSCPYPGLAYFGPEDASRFFGREQAISALVASVAKRSFTALIGASGSGKSSVVLAGLAPKLSSHGGWRSTYFRIGTEPDKNPFAALARALEPLTGERSLSDKLEEVQKLAQKLAVGSISLTNCIGQCRVANPGKRILLIADQFEEAFTFIPNEALRNRFVDALIDAFPDPDIGAMPDVCLVLTLRADFYTAALRHRPLADKLQDRVENLGPLTRDELREAIIKPAEQLEPSVTFEPGLAGAILEIVERRPGSLPLLQFALREMWGRLKTPLMTRADYDAIGGVEGALAKRAQAIFEDVTKKETDAASVALFRHLFTRLVTLGEGAEDTRRIVGREELGHQEWALAQRLAGEDNRLVVTAATSPEQETVEVAHEALIRNWPALAQWLSRDRAFISWRNQLKQRLDDWRKSPSDEGTLLRGGPLVVAEDWVARRGEELNAEEKAFVAKSIELRDAEKRKSETELHERQARLKEVAEAQEKTAEAQREMAGAQQSTAGAQKERAAAQVKTGQAQRRAQWALGSIAAVIVLAGALFWWLYATETLALQHQHANLLGELANTRLANRNPDASLRFAAKGTEDDVSLGSKSDAASTSMTALAAAVSHSDWRLAFRAGEKGVRAAAFSPDGSRIVTASEDKTARLWDAATAKEIAVLRGHESVVNSAAFSPDGSRIVTASSDKTARIWDAATAKELAILRSDEGVATTGVVTSAAFSPDGTRVVTTSDDNTARVWDAAAANEIVVLRGHDDGVSSAAFSPDGTRIVTASWDNTARVWDAATAKEIAVLRGHENWVLSAAFSPDGTRIVTASDDKTARVWDAVRAKEIAVLRGHESVVTSAAFSPDGTRILTASIDKTARVWEIAVLRVHEDRLSSAAFSPDGTRIVTASTDKTARVWDAATAKAKEIAVLRGHEGWVLFAAYSPDGTRIVTASADGTARVWDTATAKEIAVLRGHEGWVSTAAFSPNGTRILTASVDKTVRVWDAATAKEIAVRRGHEDWVSSAAFSPDGTRIVTASYDNTARVWDAVTAKEIAILRGHEQTVNSAAFSPDGTRIVTASYDNTARLWDAATAKEIAILRGHEDRLRTAAFSPDGTRIVTASEDKTARLWDAATAKEIAVLRGHENSVHSAAFSPDGTRIVTASEDKTARVWDAHFMTMPPKGLLAEVCQRRLIGSSTMTRDEMRLAGYSDSEPLIDVCAGIIEARP